MNKNVQNNALNDRIDHFKSADVKVLMLGAKRAGKTSLLSLLSDKDIIKLALNNTELKLETKGMDLSHIRRIMEGYCKLEDENGNIIRTYRTPLTLDDAPNEDISHYEMQLATTKTNANYKIAFTDIVGEDLRKLHNNTIDPNRKNELKDLVTMADVIIVTVDSVLLMENEGTNASSSNNIEEVTSLIRTCCPPQEGSVYKLFLFVPVKCEKYYNEHIEYMKSIEGLKEKSVDEYREKEAVAPMQQLLENVKKYYSELFDYFKKGAGNSYFQAAILPVLTLGDIEFRWFKATSLSKPVLDAADMIFRYKTQLDPVTNTLKDPQFQPKYVEQILIYILLFQLRKVKVFQESRSLFGIIKDIFVNAFRRLASNKTLIEQAPLLARNLCDKTTFVHEVIQNPINFTTTNK